MQSEKFSVVATKKSIDFVSFLSQIAMVIITPLREKRIIDKLKIEKNAP